MSLGADRGSLDLGLSICLTWVMTSTSEGFVRDKHSNALEGLGLVVSTEGLTWTHSPHHRAVLSRTAESPRHPALV